MSERGAIKNMKVKNQSKITKQPKDNKFNDNEDILTSVTNIEHINCLNEGETLVYPLNRFNIQPYTFIQPH